MQQVDDDEVKVERVLTAEEQRIKDEEERAEAARRAAAAKDNARERGIMDMMYGRLEGKAEDDVWIDIPKPPFMDEVGMMQAGCVCVFCVCVCVCLLRTMCCSLPPSLTFVRSAGRQSRM